MAEDQLEPLITECPNCSTRFRVTEAQLEVASGRVRCGACLTVFQGTEHLLWEGVSGFETTRQAQQALDDLLNELDADGEKTEPSGKPVELTDLGSLGADPPGSNFTPPTEGIAADWEPHERQLYVGHEDSGYEIDDDDDAAEDAGSTASELWLPAAGLEDSAEQDRVAEPEQSESSTPEESAADKSEQIFFGTSTQEMAAPAPPVGPVVQPAAHQPAPGPDPLTLDTATEVSFAPEPRRWWVGGLMLLAVLALAGQIFWYQFESWGRDPTLRPVYAAICDLFSCELPVLRDIQALRTEKLLVRSHPDLANALIVDTVIVNEAAFAQPFPALELRFTTIDGKLVAGRLFEPAEYLAGDLAGATMMAPNTPIRLALEIEDPGGDAVSYFLSFR